MLALLNKRPKGSYVAIAAQYGWAPYPSIWRVAYVHGVTLAGAINSTAPYEMTIDIANTGRDDYARGFAKERWVISGIAVRADVRGRGIGKALLRANEITTKQQGAGVIVGFKDDANGSPLVYKSPDTPLCPIIRRYRFMRESSG